MMLNYHTVDGNWFDKLYAVLTAFEAARRDPHNPSDGTITIGVGFNISANNDGLRVAVFAALGLNYRVVPIAGAREIRGQVCHLAF